MHIQRFTIRNTTLVLVIAFVAALAAAISAAVVWQLRPAQTFTPLTIQDHLVLTSGSGTPPQIQSGKTLVFNQTTWCSSLSHDTQAHVSITVLNVDTPPQEAQSVLSGLPAPIRKGCTSGHNLSLSLPTPLSPGMWRLALTISVVDAGRTQTLSVLSDPFVVSQ